MSLRRLIPHNEFLQTNVRLKKLVAIEESNKSKEKEKEKVNGKTEIEIRPEFDMMASSSDSDTATLEWFQGWWKRGVPGMY